MSFCISAVLGSLSSVCELLLSARVTVCLSFAPRADEKTNAVVNSNRQWIKRIGTGDKIEHLSWKHVYQRIAEATHCEKGFIVHEAVSFNPTTRRWYFLPRKMRCAALRGLVWS